MKSLKQAARGSARALLVGLVAAAALAGCGGGSEPIEAFAPTRLVAFGDEASVLTADGRKYSVNAINSVSNAVDCASNPLWIQVLANRYGMVFPQCNPSNLAAPQGRIMAANGAKLDDVRAQLDRYLASDVMTEHTLVTLFVGTHDILGLYAQYPAQSEGDLMNAAGDAGRQLGELAVHARQGLLQRGHRRTLGFQRQRQGVRLLARLTGVHARFLARLQQASTLGV